MLENISPALTSFPAECLVGVETPQGHNSHGEY